MVTYASDGAAIVEEIATQGLAVAIFGGDGIADVSFGDAFTDINAISGITATKPASGETSELSTLFGVFYEAAATAASFEGGIYTAETFDAIAIIGLAQATALRTPSADDGVKEMLGLAIASPDSPQEGASGSHSFDENGDVAGSGFDICTFSVGDDGKAALDCHSSWGLFDGLDDNGIPKKEAEPEPEPEPEEAEEDEVPGFGLLSALAAVGVALVLRRRL